MGEAWLFSGQGSQTYQMGKEYDESEPAFHDCLNECDAVVKAIRGEGFLGRMYDTCKRRHDPFRETRETHPAVFSVQYSMARLLEAKGVERSLLIGYSLGEFVAAVVSGAVTLEDGLRMVVKHADLLRQHARPGGMLAVLSGADVLQKEEVRKLAGGMTVAAVNSHRHFVLAGEEEALERMADVLGGLDVATMGLPVEYAFHSEAMDPVEPEFRRWLSTIAMREPCCAVYSCLTGERVKHYDVEHFARVARGKVCLPEVLKVVQSQWGGGIRYRDLGPSGTMANFAAMNLPDGRERVLAMMNALGRKCSPELMKGC